MCDLHVKTEGRVREVGFFTQTPSQKSILKTLQTHKDESHSIPWLASVVLSENLQGNGDLRPLLD